MSAKGKGGIAAVLGAVISLLSLFFNYGAEHARGAKIISPRLQGEFRIGGSSKLTEFYTTLFWITLIIGIVIIIVGIIIAVTAVEEQPSSHSDGEKTFSESTVEKRKWICPSCRQVNFPSVTKCISCGTLMGDVAAAQRFSAAQVGANEWKCPNCGRVNQNYVGTCGCGTTKPR